MIKKLLENFYLRNLILLLVLTSVHVGSRSTSRSFGNADFLIAYMFAAWSYACYMFHNIVLYERFLKRRKYIVYLAMFILLLFVYREVYNQMTSAFQQIWIRLTTRGWLAMHWMDTIYFYLALGAYLAYKYSKDRERLLESEHAKKELELKQLNEQLNPHFLFNALNNIYSHLLRETGDGKELVLRLSELMRYILDSSKTAYVPLHYEVEFIENYIAFEKERLDTRCVVNYQCTIYDNAASIVPLIMFNFIENAFKHGTTSMQTSTVRIHLWADSNVLKLEVSNPVFAKEDTTMTGLYNTRRRLDLLYPERHNLEIMQDKEMYHVQLEITLN